MACAIKISGFISPPCSSGTKPQNTQQKLSCKEKGKESKNYMQNKIGNSNIHTTGPQTQRNCNVANVTQKTYFFITQLCQRQRERQRWGWRVGERARVSATHIACIFAMAKKLFGHCFAVNGPRPIVSTAAARPGLLRARGAAAARLLSHGRHG